MKAVILKARVMVRGTKIKILKWEILFYKPSEMGTLYGVFSSKKNFGQLLLTNCWPSPWWIQKCHQKWVSDWNMGAFLNTGVGSSIFRWKTAQTHMYRSPIPPGPLYGLYFENRKKCFDKNRENNDFLAILGQTSLRIWGVPGLKSLYTKMKSCSSLSS